MLPSPPPELRVGVDVVAVDRMARLLGEHDVAAKALFTPAELRYCHAKRRCAEHLAARFAAKEAVLKSLGTGMRGGMRWTDVEVVNEPSGRPTVVLHGEARRLAGRHGIGHVDVSLTHAGGLAVAHALAVTRPTPCASN